MHRYWILPVLLVALASSAWYLVSRDRPTDASPSVLPQVHGNAPLVRNEPQLDPVRPLEAGATGSRVSEEMPSTVEEEAESTAEVPALRVTARVLDILGKPLAGVPIQVVGGGSETVTSDGYGVIELELPAAETSIQLQVDATLAEHHFATVRSCTIRRSEAVEEHFLIAAPGITMAGRIVDGDGLPLANVSVRSDPRNVLLTGFPLPLDRTSVHMLSATSDSEGAFELAAVPVLEGHKVYFRKENFERQEEAVPSRSNHSILVTLARNAEERALVGRVLLPDGSPATGATVQLGWKTTSTDPGGEFSLPLSESTGGDVLAAGLSGYSPAFLVGFEQIVMDAAPEAPAPVELQLRDALTIKGRVENEHGQPLSGWLVMIREGLALTFGSLPPHTVESLAGSSRIMTGTDGSFELTGLSKRGYEVWAYQTKTLQATEGDGPVLAGTHDLVLVAPTSGLRSIAGTVTSRRGTPLVGLRVALNRITHRSDSGWASVGGQHTALTDQEGHFDLEQVPTGGISIGISGTSVVPESFDLGPREEQALGGSDQLVLRVAQRCHFQLEVFGPDTTDLSLTLIDADEQQLPIYSFQIGTWTSSSTRTIEEGGRTPVLAVSEDAQTLVVRRGSQELHRGPVSLAAETVNSIRIDIR